VKLSGNDGEQVPYVNDGKTNLFLKYPSQANKASHFHTSSQLPEELDEEIQHG
jgi:hypothetical protein